MKIGVQQSFAEQPTPVISSAPTGPAVRQTRKARYSYTVGQTLQLRGKKPSRNMKTSNAGTGWSSQPCVIIAVNDCTV